MTNAVEYMRVMFYGCVVLYLVPTLDDIFIARGRTWLPMALNVLAIGVNFVLNPLLIYGNEVAERMPDMPFAQAFDGLRPSSASRASESPARAGQR